jgi:hypothetical protein
MYRCKITYLRIDYPLGPHGPKAKISAIHPTIPARLVTPEQATAFLRTLPPVPILGQGPSYESELTGLEAYDVFSSKNYILPTADAAGIPHDALSEILFISSEWGRIENPHSTTWSQDKERHK